MNSRKKLLIAFIGLFIMFSAFGTSKAADIGVKEGKTFKWDIKISITGITSLSGSMTMEITNVGTVGDTTTVTGNITISMLGIPVEVSGTILTWNNVTEVATFGIQATVNSSIYTVLLAPRLDLDVVAAYVGGTVTGTNTVEVQIPDGPIAVSTFDDNGVLISMKASDQSASVSVTRTASDEVSFGYAFLFIIPAAVIALVIRKRKSMKLI